MLLDWGEVGRVYEMRTVGDLGLAVSQGGFRHLLEVV